VLSHLFDWERFTHSLKTAIACIAGLLLSKAVGFPADQWIVITIIVVMCAQLYVGSVLQKAYLRFIGTCLGCLFAIGAIELINNTLFTIAITVGLSSFLFSYAATSQDKYSYVGTLGAVTTAIILLGQAPTVEFALQRFGEISVGILIATLTSQFVLPIHARTHLRRTQASTLGQIRNLYQQAMMSKPGDTLHTDYLDLDESIVKSLSKQRQLAKESSHEPMGSAFDPKNFMLSFHCEKEMLRAIDFMHHALDRLDDKNNSFFTSPHLAEFNKSILLALDTLIRVIETSKLEGEHIHIPSLQPLKADIQSDFFYLDGFLFAALILTSNLTKLAEHYHLPVYHTNEMPH
jgi:uncharacterized membrane protein YccC